MNRGPEPGHASSKPRFTQKQGQYLAFIHAYTLVLGRPPAEADLRRHFRVTPPSVHQMLITLEREGLIRRQPGVARSIQLLIDPSTLPPLLPSQHTNQSKPLCTGTRHPSWPTRWGTCPNMVLEARGGRLVAPNGVDPPG
jgi:LexA DNA binding domain